MGVFALIQILFISFAAPVATLKVMEMRSSISDARIAATLAAILVMAQANASFPLVAVGLNLPINILTSIVAGLLASFIAFKKHLQTIAVYGKFLSTYNLQTVIEG